jgi:hypothetical protein
VDDEELEFDEQPFEVVETYASESEANVDARALVERGIGATVAPIPADELAAGDVGDGRDGGDGGDLETAVATRTFRIEVLPHDLARAQEALELVEPEERPEANPEETMVLEKGPVPWKRVLLIWLAAMIVLPLVAFLLTFAVVSR